MYKQCATEESVRRQRQLEACLLELMQALPYNQVTISDISDRAGISRKSFYRYFNSKEGCLYALLDHAIFDGASCYMPGPSDSLSLQTIYELFFRYWKEQHVLLDALARHNMQLLLVERMLNYAAQEEQEFRSILHPAATDTHERNLFYIGGVMTLLLEWHATGFRKSIPQMSKTLTELIR